MKQKMSSFQAGLLLYTTVVPTAILITPSVVMAYARQDAWMSIAGAMFAALCFAVLIGVMVRLNPGLTFQAWIGQRLGRTAAFAVGLPLGLYYLSISSVILQDFATIMSHQILPQTPHSIVMTLILFVAGYAVWSGIEVIARSNAVVTVIAWIPYGFSLILFSRIIRPEHLLPMLQQHPAAIAYGGILPLSWYSEVAVLLILAPFLQHRHKAAKIAVWGVVLSGFHLLITVLLALFVFGPELPQRFQYPSFSMIEVLRFGTVMERIDILFVAFWICTVYIKISVFLFGTYHCFLETFRLRSSRVLLGGLLAVVMLTSLTAYRDEVRFIQMNRLAIPYEHLAFNVGLPLLIGLGLMVRRKNKADEEAVACGTNALG